MRQGLVIFLVLVVILLVAGAVLKNRKSSSFTLPQGGETRKESILVEDSESVGMTKKEVFITDGVRHSIPLEEITTLLSPDQIPSIDNPKFIPIEEANSWLKDEEPGITFSVGDVQRFYPYQILVWHEIVNDTLEGQRVLVTYCPLCLTGFVLDPLVQGERVEFGTSGKLWNSNLIMYDRKTKSLWSQVLVQAIVGEATGTKLNILASDQMRYGAWKEEHPQGEVLSRETGAFRVYGSNPYDGGYFSASSTALSLLGSKERDNRLPVDAFVFGIVVNDKAKAYAVEAVKEAGVVNDTFQGKEIVLRHEKELDVVRMFEKQEDGSEVRVNPISGFWFSWAAVHPDTELYE